VVWLASPAAPKSPFSLQPGVHALVGPAGVGKTTVTAELARAAHRDGWDRVLWVSGASSWTLLAGLLAVAQDMSIAGGDLDAWWTARRVVRRLGAAAGRNLLILDAIQEDLADLLPLRQPNLTVVVTATRYDRPDTSVHRLPPFTRSFIIRAAPLRKLDLPNLLHVQDTPNRQMYGRAGFDLLRKRVLLTR
jgi:hypothetical protein